MSQYSNYKIGGRAKYFWQAKNIDELIEAVKDWRSQKSASASGIENNIFVLAGGTNLLFNDSGFDGLILKPDIKFIENSDFLVRAGAGVLISELLDFAVQNNLSGLEWAGGLPGTIGGALYGNAGAFGGEIKDLIKEVVSLDISDSKQGIIKRANEDCGFGYRTSVLKQNPRKEVIVELTLAMKPGDGEVIKKSIQEKIEYRKARHPMDYPNIGSIFKNVPLVRIFSEDTSEYKEARNKSAFVLTGSLVPVKTDPFPVVPSAHLISEAGLKGVSFGGAMISPKHPNFIVNIMNATSEDVKKLIQLAKSKVKNKFGIDLEEEIEYVS